MVSLFIEKNCSTRVGRGNGRERGQETDIESDRVEKRATRKKPVKIDLS